MFEHRHQPLVPRHVFARRMLWALAVAAVLVVISLAIGALGYRYFEGLGWIDSIYSAAMILTGMGPACELKADSAKVFATCYAFFSGLILLTSGTLIVAPFLHRLMHHFHLEGEERESQQ